MRVKCHPKPTPWGFGNNPHYDHGTITECWPFFNNGPLKLVHRVRSGTMHFMDGQYRHISFSFYCGNTGFIAHNKPNGHLLKSADKCMVFCAVCEYKAVMRGEATAEQLLGHAPRFHIPIPRIEKHPDLVFNPS